MSNRIKTAVRQSVIRGKELADFCLIVILYQKTISIHASVQLALAICGHVTKGCMALCIAPITQPGIILVEFRADAKRVVCRVGVHIRAEDGLVQSVVIDLFNPDAWSV